MLGQPSRVRGSDMWSVGRLANCDSERSVVTGKNRATKRAYQLRATIEVLRFSHQHIDEGTIDARDGDLLPGELGLLKLQGQGEGSRTLRVCAQSLHPIRSAVRD